jgi:hypothetical protein
MDDFFTDIDRLQVAPSPGDGHLEEAPGRPRLTGEFLKGPIPLAWLSPATRLAGKAPLATALAIWFEAGRRRADEVILTTRILDRFGVNRKAKYRALDALEGAGLIAVLRRPRQNPVVRILRQSSD